MGSDFTECSGAARAQIARKQTQTATADQSVPMNKFQSEQDRPMNPCGHSTMMSGSFTGSKKENLTSPL